VNIAAVPSEVQLEAWLTEYGDAVLRTCCLYLADRALAEDALQDTFIKVWRNMDRRRNESSAKTWILRIAINTCKDYKRTAWLKHVDRFKTVEDLFPASADTMEESRALFLDVMRLPAKYKQAVLLYHFHNLTMAEAASVLAVSRSTVQNRLRKAYALLRYEPEGSDNDETE
jgi:RNA polymerase sigma-70 factor, ECF subfamily